MKQVRLGRQANQMQKIKFLLYCFLIEADDTQHYISLGVQHGDWTNL